MKVIGRLPGERSCLSLVWAVLDRASRGWPGVAQTPANVRLLHRSAAICLNPQQPRSTNPSLLQTTCPTPVTPAA